MFILHFSLYQVIIFILVNSILARIAFRSSLKYLGLTVRNIYQSNCEMEFYETLQHRDHFAIQSIRDLYNSTENSDITLLCEGVKVKAHKFVLSFHSEVFKSVLEGNPGSDGFVSSRHQLGGT